MGGKTPKDTSASKQLGAVQAEFQNQSRGARQQLFQQLSEALSQGRTPEAQTEQLQRAVEAGGEQASLATRQAEEAVVRAGIGDTSYGQAAMAGARAAAGAGVQQIPTEMANANIEQAPGLINTAQQVISQQLGISAQGQGQAAMAGAQAKAQTTQAAASGAAALISIIGIAVAI